MATLNLNEHEAITLDPATSAWLVNVEKLSLQHKGCVMPQKYYDILFVWGLVDGGAQAAKLTGKGTLQLIKERETAKQEKKRKKKNGNHRTH